MTSSHKNKRLSSTRLGVNSLFNGRIDKGGDVVPIKKQGVNHQNKGLLGTFLQAGHGIGLTLLRRAWYIGGPGASGMGQNL